MNETVDTTEVNYTNFFNNNTNTFFKPYILSKSRKPIRDDRYNFILGRENKLLLFVQIGGVLTNLDELPVCTINEVNYPVKQVKKGVYEASVKLNSGEHKKDEIIYDIWSNIKVNGELFDDVEMEFVTKSKDLHFRIGGVDDVSNKFNPVVQGVNDNEVIHFDEEREVKVYFKRNYTRDVYKIVENAQYRIYINDGKRELDVLEWDNINIYSDYNTFTIHANDFLPGKYFVDVKSQMDNEIKVFKKVLQFEIKDNIINEKH
jgi:hypothetical protein